MKSSITNTVKKSVISSLALMLMLGFGIYRPAATAQAEGFLSSHREEIADALVQAHSDIHTDLETFHSNMESIRQEVQAREAENAEANPDIPDRIAKARSDIRSDLETFHSDMEDIRQEVQNHENTDPSAPAGETIPDGDVPTAPAPSLREDLLSRLSEIDREQLRTDAATAVSQAEDKLRKDKDEKDSGLIHIDISEVDAVLDDNPIEHDIGVDTDILRDDVFEHDWAVTVDNSHFSGNTYSRQPTTTPSPQPVATTGMAASYVRANGAPKTGDINSPVLWAAALGLSLMALSSAAVVLKKKA